MSESLPPKSDFRSREFLLKHVRETMSFYHPRAIDPTGGFYHFFREDGTVYDVVTRHLVSSTRFLFTFSMAYRHFGSKEYLAALKHGVDFLRNVHRNPETGGYAWVLHFDHGRKEIRNGTNPCYGLAFVLLAYAHALQGGLMEAAVWLDETFALMGESPSCKVDYPTMGACYEVLNILPTSA